MQFQHTFLRWGFGVLGFWGFGEANSMMKKKLSKEPKDEEQTFLY